LQSSYEEFSWSTAFLDRESVLNSVPHVDDERRSYIYALRNEFGGKSYEDLLKMLQSKNYSSAELHFVRYLVAEKFTVEGMTSSLMRTNFAGECAWVLRFAEDSKKAHVVIQHIDSSLLRKGGLQVSPQFDQFVEFIGNRLPKFWNTTNESDTKNFILLNRETGSPFEFYSNSVFEAMINQTPNAFSEETNSQWWKVEYLSWFACWSLNAIREINKHDYPWNVNPPFDFPEVDVRKLVAKYGNDYFTKDQGGHGRTFLPGLFFLAWYSQTFSLDGAEDLKQQFEKEAHMPFDVYLSKLYTSGVDRVIQNN